jgi:glycosyltransferase involved in cell wall biosynthesis
MTGQVSVSTADQTVLIDMSNLRSGGAVQVAASFLDELAELILDGNVRRTYPWLSKGIDIRASSAVQANRTRTCVALSVTICERRWSDREIWAHYGRKYDASFVVFGPEYGVSRASYRIVGFADGVSLFPAANTGIKSTISARSKWALRARISRLLFRRADQIVVEAPHVRAALVDRWRIRDDRVEVVPNTLNSVFANPGSWKDVTVPDTGSAGVFDVCYVTRAYAHKNLPLLGAVGLRLREFHCLEVRFVVTLTEQEWRAQSELFRQFAINVGPVTVAQLPALYRKCDASVFPSLVESFSVTPLEAMASGCVLAGSDRSFVRDIAGDAALYFNPEDPRSAADVLADLLQSADTQATLRAEGQRRAKAWPTAKDRALSYLSLIDTALNRVDRPHDAACDRG